MKIGDVEIHSVFDGAFEHDGAFTYPEFDPAAWADVPGYANGNIELPYGGFLLRGPDEHVVLYDAGAGPRFPVVHDLDYTVHSEGRLLDSLHELGVAPADITDVVYSHLHADHVGWASVDGVPTFPGARHHIHELDWRHFVEGEAAEAGASPLAPLLGAIHRWDSDRIQVTPWLELIHAPGHTPGSVVGVVESDGRFAAMVGDAFHGPVDIAGPGMLLTIDVEPAAAAERRKEWLNLCASRKMTMFAPHFPDMAPVRICHVRGGFVARIDDHAGAQGKATR